MAKIMKLSIVMLISLACCIVRSAKALANCPTGCQCDDNLLIVQCGEGQLDVLPIALNPSIQRLVIVRNKIKTIDSSIQFYAELTFLDLSANHLMNIPQRTFAYQKKLHELHLNDNKIGQLNNRTFIGLNTLNVLNLRGNLISELPATVFSAMPQLQELNLGQNRISLIDVRAFESLTQLRLLYLDDNVLTFVPDASTLQTMPRLAELMLSGNDLHTLPGNALANVGAGLTRLELRNCNLRNLYPDTFKSLANSLRVLDLSGNRFTKIPTVALSVLQRLEQLIMGENDFENIPEGAFVGLKQLQQLDISGALRLKRIMSGAFSDNTNLLKLQLASNKMLMELQEGAFSGLPHLRHVILKANALTTLAEGMFAWRDLLTLDMSENPLACDCRIMWLRTLLLLKNYTNSEDILCSYPERLRGEALINLNPQLLGCLYGSEARRQALVGALLVGAAATLTVLVLLLYRCRHKLREYLKQGSGFGGRSKEREYQKTFCDEDYMTRHHYPAPVGLMPHYVGQHNQHYVPHQTTCNMYTPPHQTYGLSCTHTMKGKDLKNCAPACLDDSASFVMLMKAHTHNELPTQQQQQQQPQTSYAKSSSVGSSLESSYSYVDVPLVHTLSTNDFKQQQQQKQPQQQKYCQDVEDPNYIYSNTHYTLPLERTGSTKITPPVVPPALPLRNTNQQTSRRSFTLNNNPNKIKSQLNQSYCHQFD